MRTLFIIVIGAAMWLSIKHTEQCARRREIQDRLDKFVGEAQRRMVCSSK